MHGKGRKKERHGQGGKGRRTGAYQSWYSMLQRCYNPKSEEFGNYGGRGLGVCAEWRRSFVAFFADMGARPRGRSLGRIDNAKGYAPSNCEWQTITEQNRNTRRNRLLEFRGETLPLVAWAERVGLTAKVVWTRIDLGWSVEKALTVPKILPGSIRGEAHWMSKLTEAKAAEIRRAYAKPGATQAGVAAQFGVAQMTVSRIVRRDPKGGWR